MKNSFGQAISVTLFGESHGPSIGVVLDGIAPGIVFDMDYIQSEMSKRRARGHISTARQEEDIVLVQSGVYNGKTTGTPIALVIENKDTRSNDYIRTQNLLRPGHADYSGEQKYLGFNDPRGGGHFSGRLTAPIVAAGAICRAILAQHNIIIGTHIARCAGISDNALPSDSETLKPLLEELNKASFAVLNEKQGEKMQQAILQAKQDLDSVGGILETAIINMPAGVGEPFFESVESVLSALLFSVPALKGVEFGLGFDFADKKASDVNDPFHIDTEGNITTTTNFNGGINGGITNGMPIFIKSVIKPTASISKAQETVDAVSGENATLKLKGRHDPAIIHRARAVVDAMVAIGLVDLMTQRFGTLWQRGHENG